jgi:hypothetical protein
MRELHGLPYAVHQIDEGQWQIVIENCPRYPSGYRFPVVYGSEEEAVAALASLHDGLPAQRRHFAGDDTGVVEWIVQQENEPLHPNSNSPNE